MHHDGKLESITSAYAALGFFGCSWRVLFSNSNCFYVCRVGVKVHVLEQSSSIRATGTSLSLWSNAWRALQCLGVADALRQKYQSASGYGAALTFEQTSCFNVSNTGLCSFSAPLLS
jgi:hypothetical protein